MSTDYYNKYLKYKNKYVDLRSTYLKLFDGLENPKDFPTSNKNKYLNTARYIQYGGNIEEYIKSINIDIFNKFNTTCIFFRDIYLKKINQKIDKKIMIKDNKIQYIKEDFHDEIYTPQFYNEWYKKISKNFTINNDKMIFENEFDDFLINQISTIINILNKSKQFDILLDNYIEAINKYWSTRKYIDLMNISSEFILYYNTIYPDTYITVLYKLKEIGYFIYLPLSFIPSEKKFIRYFSAPIYPFINTIRVVHNAFDHPAWQISHDLNMHLNYFKFTKMQQHRSIEIFYNLSTKILNDIYTTTDINICKLLFMFIHEKNDFLRINLRISVNIYSIILELDWIRGIILLDYYLDLDDSIKFNTPSEIIYENIPREKLKNYINNITLYIYKYFDNPEKLFDGIEIYKGKIFIQKIKNDCDNIKNQDECNKNILCYYDTTKCKPKLLKSIKK